MLLSQLEQHEEVDWNLAYPSVVLQQRKEVPRRMIVFKVAPFGAVWKVTRNDRLVCFFDTLGAATSAAERFSSNCILNGKDAKVLEAGSLNSLQHEHRRERQFQY